MCAGTVPLECKDFCAHCYENPCENGATCTAYGVNSYTCSCVAGYTGTNCETDIDECAAFPCKNGATCTHGLNSYQCACATGFSGTNCESDMDFKQCTGDMTMRTTSLSADCQRPIDDGGGGFNGGCGASTCICRGTDAAAALTGQA